MRVLLPVCICVCERELTSPYDFSTPFTIHRIERDGREGGGGWEDRERERERERERKRERERERERE